MKVRWSKDEAVNADMAVMISTLDDVKRDGFAYCKECGAKIYGEDLGEILELLGSHGCEPKEQK